MGTLELSLKVSNNYGDGAVKVEAIPPRLTQAWQKATQDNSRILERETRAAISSIAGGVYWDVNNTYARESNGARVRVSTSKSRSHRIVPRDPAGWLHFVIDGREVFTKEVNHPGSRPVDWLTRVAQTAPPLMKDNYDDAAHGVLERLG